MIGLSDLAAARRLGCRLMPFLDPLKVAARVRIPLGLLSETGLAVSVGQCVHTAVVYNHGLDTLDPEHPVRMR